MNHNSASGQFCPLFDLLKSDKFMYNNVFFLGENVMFSKETVMQWIK